MKVFHQYVKLQDFQPTKGDLINEYNIRKAIKTFATLTRDPKEADICYVRANKELFLSLPHPKIYFATPYDAQCFKEADAIATFSDNWTNLLKNGIPVAGSNGDKLKKAFTVIQPIGPQFKPLQHHKKTKEIRKKFGGDFIIGHFGKMRGNRIPYSLMKLLPKLTKQYPGLRVVYSDTKGFRSPHIQQKSFAYEDMPYVLSACDMLIITSWLGGGDYSGAIRTKEGMACGVPHITPNWMARKEEFGDEYPYFHRFKATTNGRHPPTIVNDMYKTIVRSIENDTLRKKISKRLIERSKKYSIKNSGEALEWQFRKVIESVQN